MINKYMVLDRDEIRESLTDTEIDILSALNDKVVEGRERKKFLMIESDKCFDALKLKSSIPIWRCSTGIMTIEDLADILEEAGL